MKGKVKTYTELSSFKTFEERLEYLRLKGAVGVDTFGFDRIFNQKFYASTEWKQIRDHVIVRDLGCDLGMAGFDILGEHILIHHMNPITIDDIREGSEFLLDPEYLITTTHTTHNAIHYGSDPIFPAISIDRQLNDTCPWKKQ